MCSRCWTPARARQEHRGGPGARGEGGGALTQQKGDADGPPPSTPTSLNPLAEEPSCAAAAHPRGGSCGRASARCSSAAPGRRAGRPGRVDIRGSWPAMPGRLGHRGVSHFLGREVRELRPAVGEHPGLDINPKAGCALPGVPRGCGDASPTPPRGGPRAVPALGDGAPLPDGRHGVITLRTAHRRLRPAHRARPGPPGEARRDRAAAGPHATWGSSRRGLRGLRRALGTQGGAGGGRGPALGDRPTTSGSQFLVTRRGLGEKAPATEFR
jgi:hypothetical protein